MEHVPPPILPRRDFLKGISVGLATAVAAYPARLAVNAVTYEATGRPVGNAASPARDYGELPTSEKIASCTAYPAIEEVMFRGIPSLVTDRTSGFDHKRIWRAATDGPKAAGLDRKAEQTRRSAICGAIGAVASTLWFGAAHNITPEGGYNTRNIPASQLLGGGIYWWLQRRFGLRAPTVSHMAHNTISALLLWKMPNSR